MAGALTYRGYADGGDVDDGTLPAGYGGGDDGGGNGAPPPPQPKPVPPRGALDPYSAYLVTGDPIAARLSASQGVDDGPAYDPSKDALYNQAGALSRGALTRMQQAGASRDQAAQQKIDAIQRAMQVLQSTHAAQTTNLPLMAAAAGLLSPTRTGSFGESLGNAAARAVPAIEAQRQRDVENAMMLGKLDVEAADVPLANEQAQEAQAAREYQMGQQGQESAVKNQAYLRMLGVRQGVAQTAADSRRDVASTAADSRRDVASTAADSRRDVANTAADSRRDVANTNLAGRLAVADINANKSRWQYIGADPDDPKTGRYLDATSGAVTMGPGVAPKGAATADPARIREAKALIDQYSKTGTPIDFPTAYGMVRAGVNDVGGWVRQVQSEKNALRQDPRFANYTDQQLEQMARDTIVSRSQGRAAAPAAPGAPAPAPAPATPAPPPKTQSLKKPGDDVLTEARRALEAGVPRNKVEDRLKSSGYDPSGL